ncbi:MAG TPA: HipA domain-containing protein [Solirubrobacterales bacterium]|nr:HipA domain-containing protein [Solirubrobacterales bacterium]
MAEVGERLRVFLNSQLVGEIERRGPSRYRFSYAADVQERDRPDEAVLSASLPLQMQPFPPAAAAPFFEGLLPEGNVRSSLARSFRISEEDGFGLLRALGGDCAGAVAVLPPDAEPAPPGGGGFRPLSERDLEQLIEDLPRHPLGVDPGDAGVRLSLGGIQHKLVLAGAPFPGFSQPLDGAPSTCLLKPELGQYEDLVTNEAFCMRVTRTAGLRAAFVNVFRIGATPCLYVERFDRVTDADRNVFRVHQEDMCQALGLLPAAKYEDNGGPSVAAIVQLLRALRGPFMARDVNDFIHAVLVNFLLGNSDAHGKNFALLYEPESGVRLAPLYDVVSTAAYPELTQRMSMALGGVTDPAKVDMQAWARLAEECQLSRGIGPIVRRRSAGLLRAAEGWRRNALHDRWHRDVIDAIIEVARTRAAQLLES